MARRRPGRAPASQRKTLGEQVGDAKPRSPAGAPEQGPERPDADRPGSSETATSEGSRPSQTTDGSRRESWTSSSSGAKRAPGTGASLASQPAPDDPCWDRNRCARADPSPARPASPGAASSASDPEPPLPALPALPSVPQCPEAAPKRAPTFSVNETLLILDWDDTCLPSSWINAHGLRLDSAVPAECWPALVELAPKIRDFLQFCKTRGDVVLITNAERGWVERSCEKFLPSVVPALHGVRVFSARSAFEQDGVFAPLEWKRRAFASAIKDALDTRAHALRSVLSLGDSPHERDALFTARDAFFRSEAAEAPRWRSKSVKFMERPDACQLLREHVLVLQFFDQVLDHDGDLDLCIKCC